MSELITCSTILHGIIMYVLLTKPGGSVDTITLQCSGNITGYVKVVLRGHLSWHMTSVPLFL